MKKPSAASLEFYRICGRALSVLRQTARSVCSKANMKEGESGYLCLYNCTQGKTKKTTVQHWNDYQDVRYEYIR